MNKEVPKIEGHATFYTHLRSGRIDEARIIGLDGERFVEKILFGRKYFEAPIITSRICGICPVIHNVTSTRAVEAALGIEVNDNVKTLRKLLLAGQFIQSHSLHLYLLILPDFVGESSSFDLQKNHPDLFGNAIKLKKYADLIVSIIGGRAVHPVSNVVGGFKKYPTRSNLKKILDDAGEVLEIAEKTLRLFVGFEYPELHRKVVYCALKNSNDYAYYDGDICSTDKDRFVAKDYKKYIYEEIIPYNRAKFASLKGKEMMVGSIARYNLSGKNLNAETKKIVEELKIKPKLDNPFDNIIAQAIENYYFVSESINMVKKLINNPLVQEKILEPKKFSEGTAACEAPRGTLFHYYKIDKDGFIEKSDIITPTVQNLASLEFDMKKLSPLLKNKKPTERNKIIEMLIRAYDPCITCATH